MFQSAATQWRTGMSGASGLDYNVLPWLIKLQGAEDEAAIFQDLRIMERAALSKMHERQGDQ